MKEKTLQTYLTGEAPFVQDDFVRVPACFATMYGWVWDTEITREGIREKIDTMVENDIRGFYILPLPAEFRPRTMVTRLDPPYLSEAYFDLVHYAIEYAEKHGIYCWLYDEGGWPSGSACGRIRCDWHDEKQTREFIESTHVPYADALRGCHPGLMFTDEPCRRNPVGTWEEATAAFTASFLQIADFCHRRGWLTGGHLDKDNTAGSGRTHGYGSALQCLQTLDIPGIDAIGWQIGSVIKTVPGWDGDMPFFPRMASSAAAQSGHALALTETFAAYGNAVSPDEMRRILGVQIVRGINLLNFLLMPYDGRDWFPCHERTLFSPDMPGFGHLHAVTAEFERAAYFMAHGSPATDVALLFPQTESWRDGEAARAVVDAFCRRGIALEEEGIDFDIVDETTLSRGKIKDGSLSVGLACYRQIIVPENAELKPRTKEILAALNGQSTSVVRTGSRHLWHKVRRDANGQLFLCIFNHDLGPQTSTVRVDTALPLYRLNARDGGAKRFANGSSVTLQSGEMLLLYAGHQPIRLSPAYTPVGQTQAKPLGMQKKAQLVLNEHGAQMVPCNDPLVPVCDFAAAFGKDFSGEVAYSYTFSADEEGPVLVTASGVDDSAEVRLNGAVAGYLTTKPYELLAHCKRGINELTLTVANQAANAFVAADMSQWFTEAQIGPYHKDQLSFEAMNCRGGLTGPVTVTFLKEER